jgi:hypothetical protein
LLFAGLTQAGGFADTYPGAWSDAPNSGIQQALIKNGARGCGEYWYKAAASSPNEYLVYCTRDGKNWTAYLVWTSAGKIMGPNQISPDIRPPR